MLMMKKQFAYKCINIKKFAYKCIKIKKGQECNILS